MEALTPETDTRELHGSGIIAALKTSGIEYVLALPDIVTSSGLLAPIARDKDFRLIRVCKEDECIGIASGLHYSNKRALILIQYTGFLDSLNAIRAVAVEYKQPICMMVGLLGHAAECPPSESSKYGVRIIEPICEAMGIPHHVIDQAEPTPEAPPRVIRGEVRPVSAIRSAR